MNLIESTIGVDSGLSWEQNLNSSLTLIDAHDHSPGKGVPINSSSLNLTSDLALNGNNLTLVRSLRFNPQSSLLSGPADLGCLYESGVDLWYNDGNGNQVKITSAGSVNATSSGISSGTATASFVSGVLVVDASSNYPANIQGASILLGNNVTNSKYLTLSPPNSLAANYSVVLPLIPSVKNILSMDTSGNIVADTNVDNSSLSYSGTVLSIATNGVTTPTIAAQAVTYPKLGVSNFASSASSATFSTSSVTFVTALTVSLTSQGGRPIVVTLQPDGTNNFAQFFNNSTTFQVQIVRNGTGIFLTQTLTNGDSLPPNICITDYGVSGVGNIGTVYTYQININSNNGSFNTNLLYCVLTVREV